MTPKPRKLFERYASSLAKVCPELVGKYCCPLTLALVPLENVDLLSVEHCIPDGLAETPFVLTLRIANNEAGRQLDAHLHRHLRFKEFLTEGIGEYRVRITTTEQDLGAIYTREVKANGTASNFAVSAKATDPKHLTEQGISKFGENSGFQIVFNSNDSGVERLAQIALLKAGYLLAFSHLGYTFILGGCVDAIRQQIKRPDETVLPVERLVQSITPDQVLSGVSLVFEPEQYLAAFVDIALAKNTNATKSCYRVFLPCSQSNIDCWREITSEKFRVVRVPEGDYVAHPRSWFERVPLSD